MMDKHLTRQVYIKDFDEVKIAARLDEGKNLYTYEAGEVVYGPTGAAHKVSPDKTYLTGDIVERLYAYEQLEYSPEELKEIIRRYQMYKLEMNSVYGGVAFMLGRQNGKTELQRQIYDYICSDLKARSEVAAWAQACACVRKKPDVPEIKNVIFNDPATIVFWADGTKTVVKATNEDFDPEKGLAMAIVKKTYGNEGNYFNKIKKWTKNVVNLRGMIVRLNEKRDRDRLAKAYAVLNGAYTDRKATKSDLGIAIEEAIGLLGQVLDD